MRLEQRNELDLEWNGLIMHETATALTAAWWSQPYWYISDLHTNLWTHTDDDFCISYSSVQLTALG